MKVSEALAFFASQWGRVIYVPDTTIDSVKRIIESARENATALEQQAEKGNDAIRENVALRQEIEELKEERDRWIEEARRYAKNTDYWRERTLASERNFNTLADERFALREQNTAMRALLEEAATLCSDERWTTINAGAFSVLAEEIRAFLAKHPAERQP